MKSPRYRCVATPGTFCCCYVPLYGIYANAVSPDAALIIQGVKLREVGLLHKLLALRHRHAVTALVFGMTGVTLDPDGLDVMDIA